MELGDSGVGDGFFNRLLTTDNGQEPSPLSVYCQLPTAFRLLPIAGRRIEAGLEEAQVFGFVDHLQAARLVALLVNLQDRLRHHIYRFFTMRENNSAICGCRATGS